MRMCHFAVFTGLAVSALGSGVAAQEQVVASLPWQFGQTAGPNGTDYETTNDRDVWVVEDFGIASDVNLTRFESYGTIFPTPLTVIDVIVRIYGALPTTGNIVLQSTPGSGHVIVNGINYRIAADFGGQFLRAGNYYVVWQAQTHGTQIAIFWAQGGPHQVGSGGADNAWQWNPGLGWNWPTGAIRPVPADLSGNGQTGTNFVLYGTPGCYANCDRSTAAPVLNVNDFTCFLNQFAAGSAYANCDGSTTAPVLNVNDFTCFLNRFAAGCA